MSAQVRNIPFKFDADNSDVPIGSQLEEFINSADFDLRSSKNAYQHTSLSSDESGDSDDDTLLSNDDSFSSGTSAEVIPEVVPKIEAKLYYAGVGLMGRGPKLIYRTSDDIFEEPSGPEAYKRLMRIIAVPDDHEFGQNGMWDRVRDQVVELLNQKNVKVSSVEFVRFTWLNKKEEQEIEEEESGDDDDSHTAGEEEELSYDDLPPIQYIEDGKRHYTNPTIWIGVLPDTLTGATAQESSKDIRAFLDSLQVQNVDIAYRESRYSNLSKHGPPLFRPVEDGDPLKEIIDNVSVPLSLCISGYKSTSPKQGTLGPYFCVGKKLYAITARHVLFSADDDNSDYRLLDSAPKKEVIVMGSAAFRSYLASIQTLIGANAESITSREKKISALRTRMQGRTDIQESQSKLDQYETELATLRINFKCMMQFYTQISTRWGKSKDRIIGFVRWAPSIGVGDPPHRYNRDFCVIELYKDKFKHMIGNVLSLGPELSRAKFNAMMHERDDVPFEFRYPDDGLLTLRNTLDVNQINTPNTLTLQGDRIRRVLKRGFGTNTTVGTLTGFRAFVRQYFPTGNLESLEVVILSHEDDPAVAFSQGGDSGSLIVSAAGEFVALLTGGTNKGTKVSDITYATPFEWIWTHVRNEFPGANLYFDNLENFFQDAQQS